MAYINTETNYYPISEEGIKELFPNTSFAIPFSPPENFAWVAPAPQIEYNSTIQNCIEDKPELTPKGIWQQKWKVVDKFSDVISENGTVITSKEEQEQKAIEEFNSILKQQIANQAKIFLQETDWSQYPDVRLVLDNVHDFDLYRVELRSYIINPPISVDVWPTKPKVIWK